MRKTALVVLLAALAGAALAYAAALGGDFHFDDESSIQTNWRLRSLGATARAFGPLDYLGPARPVTEITFALDYAAAGLSPTRFHATSLALHLAVALLVFLLARGVLERAGHPRAEPLAAVAAAAFALHPMQCESVAYAAQRAEVLAALLGLASVLVLLAADAARPRARAFVLSLAAALLLALALGAKTTAVAYPFAFVLHRLVVGGPRGQEAPLRARGLRALALAAPSLALSVASVARNLLLLGPGSTAGLSAGDLGPWRYLLTQLRAHWLYVRLLAFPAGLSVDHGEFPASAASPDLATAAAGLALLALAALAFLLWRGPRREACRPAAFGILLWFLLLVPTSSFVPIVDLVAEHRTYLASAGLLLAAAVGIEAVVAVTLPGRRGAAAQVALTIGLLGALGGALALRARVWRSPVALWADAVEKSPRSFRAAHNHAYALDLAGARGESLREYARARSLATRPREVAEVDENLSAIYNDSGDPASALAATDDGIAAAPWHAMLRNNRAVALFYLGRYAEALAEAQRGLSLDPALPALHDTLGASLRALGEPGRALEEFRLCNRIDPDEQRCRAHEAQALAALGRREEACRVYRALVTGSASPALSARVRSQAAELGCR